MFRDECEIEVLAGKGGDGLVSFRREKFVPRGGPNGGNGGEGGSVVLVASERVSSLLSIGRKPRYRAENGRPGGPNLRTGAKGEDRVLEVPVGTLVKDAEHGNLLKDLSEADERLVVAVGGRPGRGNAAFATAVRQVPRQAERGREGEARRLALELKLFAQVGLVGLPNAGKSTFLTAVSRARPKIASYPFTTLAPIVGIAPVGDLDSLVLADLPGLIEGAAEGAGLGHRFLRHVERCRVLLHLVDVSGAADTPPLEALEILEEELGRYSQVLLERPRLIVASKCEGPEAEENARTLAREKGEDEVLPISSLHRQGLQQVLLRALAEVQAATESSQ